MTIQTPTVTQTPQMGGITRAARSPKAFVAAAALVIGFAPAPALHAEESSTPQESHDSMMSPGMMGGDSMMNMMEDMSQMEDMMDHCSQMMSGGSGKPNEQWRKNAPTAPDDSD